MGSLFWICRCGERPWLHHEACPKCSAPRPDPDKPKDPIPPAEQEKPYDPYLGY